MPTSVVARPNPPSTFGLAVVAQSALRMVATPFLSGDACEWLRKHMNTNISIKPLSSAKQSWRTACTLAWRLSPPGWFAFDIAPAVSRLIYLFLCGPTSLRARSRLPRECIGTPWNCDHTREFRTDDHSHFRTETWLGSRNEIRDRLLSRCELPLHSYQLSRRGYRQTVEN